MTSNSLSIDCCGQPPLSTSSQRATPDVLRQASASAATSTVATSTKDGLQSLQQPRNARSSGRNHHYHHHPPTTRGSAVGSGSRRRSGKSPTGSAGRHRPGSASSTSASGAKRYQRGLVRPGPVSKSDVEVCYCKDTGLGINQWQVTI